MDSSTRDVASTSSADAVEFVRFCYRRRRVGWPELYDEMCAVASRGLYRGWGTDELAAQGIGFSLFELGGLSALVSHVLAEEQQRRQAERASRHEPADHGTPGGNRHDQQREETTEAASALNLVGAGARA